MQRLLLATVAAALALLAPSAVYADGCSSGLFSALRSNSRSFSVQRQLNFNVQRQRVVERVVERPVLRQQVVKADVVQEIRLARVLLPLVQVTEVRSSFDFPFFGYGFGYSAPSPCPPSAARAAPDPCADTRARLDRMERAFDELLRQQKRAPELEMPRSRD